MAAIDISSTAASLNDGVLQLQNGVAMDSTLRNVADQSNTTSPLKLSTLQVQVTSTLKITTSDNPYIDAEDSSGNNRFTIGRDPSTQIVNVDFASNPTLSTEQVGSIRTYTNGVALADVMSFRRDGNIGIGTTAPTAKLTIDSGDLLFTTAGNSQITGLRNGVNQDTRIIINNQSTGGLHLGAKYGNPSGCIYFECGTSAYTERMRLTPSGNLLIGTTSDTARLYIVGSGSTSATTSLLVQNSLGTNTLQVKDDGNATLSGGLTTSGILSFADVGIQAGLQVLTTVGIGGYNAAKDGTKVDIYGSQTTSSSYGGAQSLWINNTLLANNNSYNLIGLRINPTFDHSTFVGTVDYGIQFNSTFAFSTGTNNSTNFILNPTYNYTGGTNTVRGIYYNPTLTSLTNTTHYGIQTTSGGAYINTATPEATACLQADSTTQGFLPPRMTNAERAAITTPAIGLMVYCTDAVEGIYVYKSTGWTFVA